MLRLLLDENLSPAVALALREGGWDIIHIRERGLLGATDPQVLEYAFNDDRVLITANVNDFVKLTTAREIHAGVVLIENGSLGRAEQRELLDRVLASLASRDDTVNLILRVAIDGALLYDEPPP